MNAWLPWAPLGAAILHMSEEFVWPGGFMGWYRSYRNNGERVTPKFLAIVNLVLLVVCVDIGLLGAAFPGIPYWLTISALLCSNGIWHAWAGYRSHGYSPGMITGSLIYVPLAIYGYAHFLRSGEASVRVALAAAAVGGSYPFWSALYHRLSGKGREGR